MERSTRLGISRYLYMGPHQEKETAKYFLENTPLSQALLPDELSTILAWVREELEPGEGSYAGFKMGSSDFKTRIEIQRRITLYPTYDMWAVGDTFKSQTV
uniref:Uncharacterized protein ORF100_1 n=1 Tax=Nothoceros aenigmaticus TaxID=13813 RepID=C3RYM0_9EMBR|nr:hypothetical protein MeaeMp10 [Nothoceros aenigmaticus]ACC86777.1 hypothetical protein MeaeMp10 [Nothoceros aenigmaticus]